MSENRDSGVPARATRLLILARGSMVGALGVEAGGGGGFALRGAESNAGAEDEEEEEEEEADEEEEAEEEGDNDEDEEKEGWVEALKSSQICDTQVLARSGSLSRWAFNSLALS